MKYYGPFKLIRTLLILLSVLCLGGVMLCAAEYRVKAAPGDAEVQTTADVTAPGDAEVQTTADVAAPGDAEVQTTADVAAPDDAEGEVQTTFYTYIDYVNKAATASSRPAMADIQSTITGDGTYTVSLPATALQEDGAGNGAQRLRVIIIGLAEAVADSTLINISGVSVKCDDKRLTVADDMVFCEPVNGGDFALELIDEAGPLAANPAVASIDIDFTKELSVEFTISGITEGVRENEQLEKEALEDGSALLRPEADSSEDPEASGEVWEDADGSREESPKGSIGTFTMIGGKEVTVTSSTNNGETASAEKSGSGLWKLLLGSGILLVLGVGIFFVIKKK